MFWNKTTVIFSKVLPHLLPFQISCCHASSFNNKFNPEKVLVLTKISRYDFEKRRNSSLNESELKHALTARGSDYEMLLRRHNMHKSVERSVVSALRDVGIDTRVVNRFNYNDANINWADAIVTTGGDGTYLLAASKIPNNKKPVIGFNSDPSRSKGQLCLPDKYSFRIKEAIDKLLQGKFKWQFRSRIRITLIGENIYEPPVELHEQQLQQMEHRYLDIDHQLRLEQSPPPVSSEYSEDKLQTRVLPVLALNEVFIGECISARVSYLEIKFDDKNPVKQKCSGLIVSTGTGSTSWTYNVNKLTEQSLEQILSISQEETGISFNNGSSKHIQKITDKFNQLLLNDPEDNRLVYTIRDQLVPPSLAVQAKAFKCAAGVGGYVDGGDPNVDFNAPLPRVVKPRGFAQKIHVRSRCFDASLVIDGGLSFTFNDGTRALLEMHEVDALRNVVLDESETMVSFKH